MTVHTAVRVRKVGEYWVAPCSCGLSWTHHESRSAANRLRNKHIRAAALEERRRSKEAVS